MQVLTKLFKIAAIVLLCIIWMYSIYCYFIFPETIPIHFNLSGQVDGFGNKATLLILPIISIFIFFVIGYASSATVMKSSFSNGKPISENFKPFHTLFLHYLRCMVLLLFLSIIISTHLIVIKKIETLSLTFDFILIALIFLPTIFYAYKAIKSN